MIRRSTSTPLKHRWSLGHNYLAGITSGAWYRLLRENRFQVSAAYWHRAAFITASSVINSCSSLIERWRFGDAIERTELTQPPLFLLGHWRSGTTLLHYLLAQHDTQFNFANTYQVVNPRTFLTTEKVVKRFGSRLVPPTRPMDNMQLSFNTPQEDEFAPLLLTLCSPYLGISFPHHIDNYAKYLTFHGVPRPTIEAWQQAFIWFCKKLTLQNPRSLLLKSPPHTARIRLLLEMFPDARFVHIHRDPYRVFQSQKHFFDTAGWYTYLQAPDLSTMDDDILQRYTTMYDAYFEDLALIAPDRFCEVRFDDLVADPVGQTRQIYEQLSLPDFESFEPKLRTYVDSLADYQPNRFPTLDEHSRELVATHWSRSFQRWGYSV
ncbi:sulfotransferase family protein [Roseimaritima ulvae]|uniref:Sulfotransferase domain protein n=1 Tax=Roseimaritima ulvae TaxID=980254 RepID=A0A5B9QJV0_9BACT|nr:sulfotransferase [Roseimaritima ulvae]QEG38249.1 Sulfotransferase domain protein [Roseimaritima ulvae]